MFDTYNLRPGAQHHHHEVTVTEKRAPTDESVRLLKEMEEKALAKVLKSARVENCPVDCVVFHMRDHKFGDDKFHLRFKVNGREDRIELVLAESVVAGGREEVVMELVRRLGERIAAEMLREPLTKLMRERVF